MSYIHFYIPKMYSQIPTVGIQSMFLNKYINLYASISDAFLIGFISKRGVQFFSQILFDA